MFKCAMLLLFQYAMNSTLDPSRSRLFLWKPNHRLQTVSQDANSKWWPILEWQMPVNPISTASEKYEMRPGTPQTYPVDNILSQVFLTSFSVFVLHVKAKVTHTKQWLPIFGSTSVAKLQLISRQWGTWSAAASVVCYCVIFLQVASKPLLSE